VIVSHDGSHTAGLTSWRGGFATSGGRLRASATGTDCIGGLSAITGASDATIDVEVNCTSLTTVSCAGAALRIQSSSAHYLATLTGAGTVEICKYNGSFTVLASTTVTLGTGTGVLRASIAGDTIQVWWRGTLVLTTTDTSFTGTGDHGIYLYAPSSVGAAEIDGFTVSTPLYSYYFTGTDGAAPGAPWNAYTGGGGSTAVINSNRLRLIGNNGDYITCSADGGGSPLFRGSDITLDISFAANPSGPTVMIITSVAGGGNDYALTLGMGANWAAIQRRDAWVSTTLNSVTWTPPTAGTVTKVRFQRIGTTFKAKLWEAGTAEPGTWLLEATDSTYSTPGSIELAASGGGGNAITAYIDNIQIVDQSGAPQVEWGIVKSGTSGSSQQPYPPARAGLTGDFRMIWAAYDSTTAPTTPAGWTLSNTTNTSELSLFLRLCTADGETWPTISGQNQDFVMVAGTVPVGGHSITDLAADPYAVVATTTGSSATPNPASVTISTTPVFTVVAGVAIDFSATGNAITAGPTSYFPVTLTKSAASTSSVALGVAERPLYSGATSEDPGAFASTSRPWIAKTVAIPLVALNATNAPAGNATAAGTASSPSTTVSTGVESASAAGSAYNPAAGISIPAEVDHRAAMLGFQAIGDRIGILPSGAIDEKDRPWGIRLYDMASTAPVGAPAQVSNGTGIASNPSVIITAAIQASQATGSAGNVASIIAAGIQRPQASGTASNVTALMAVASMAQVAQGSGAAYSPAALKAVSPTAGVATASGSAGDVGASKALFAGAQVATGSASVPGGVGSGKPSVGSGSASGTAQAPKAAQGAAPTAALGTGQAQASSTQTAPQAGVAQASGTASWPTASVRPTAPVAQASGVANQAIAMTADMVFVQAGLATATSSAFDPSVAQQVRPPAASASGQSLAPPNRVAPNTGNAQGSGTASNPTAGSYQVRTATPTTAQAAGYASNPGTQEAVRPSVASATGSAFNASTTAYAVVNAAAQAAWGSGTTSPPVPTITARPPQAAGAATTQASKSQVRSNAGSPQGSGTASNPKVNRSVELTPATPTFTAQTLSAVPGTIAVTISAPTITFTPSIVGPVAATVMQLSASVSVLSAQTLYTSNSRPIDHRASSLGFQAIGDRLGILPSGAIDDKDRPWGVKLYDREILARSLDPATPTFTASQLLVTTGPKSVSISAATATFAAQQPQVNGMEVAPQPAYMSLQGQMLVAVGSPTTVTIGPATITLGASPLISAISLRLDAATTTWQAQDLSVEPPVGSRSQFFPRPLRVSSGLLTTSPVLLYTVPADSYLVLKQVTLQKVSASDGATRLWATPALQSPANAYAFFYDVAVAGTLDQEMNMVLAPGERLYGRAASENTVAHRIDGFLLSTASLPMPRVFFRGVVGTTFTEVAVVMPNRQRVIKYISIANTSAAERTVDISTTTAGSAPGDGGAIRRALAVPAHSSVFIPLTMVLDATETLAVKADTAGAVALQVCGAVG